MKYNKIFCLFILALHTALYNSCTKGHVVNSQQPLQPNVIIILTDDQGYGDFSVHGNPVLKTPVLDKLHAQSIRFTDFHSAPMCTPTRSQLMTGRDAMDNGATTVNQGRSMIREELPTMADIFKASGYKTAHFGKWHLGESYPYRPQDRGFDETVHHGAWGVGSMADHYGNDYWNDSFLHNGKLEDYKGYCTDVWFNLTIDYIKQQQKNQNPFFIYLATNTPHAPHLVDKEYSDPYLKKGIKPKVARFFGQIANIDENMGRLLLALDQTNLAENTIVIYLSDNGTVQGHEIYNAGMRGHKTEPYEGGHRVPLFIRWPNGNMREARDIDKLTHVQDILPTLIDLCRLKKPQNADFDGVSMAPALYGKMNQIDDDRILVVEYENPYKPKENRAVLWKKWRLVKNNELYDLSIDPGQKNDVADQHSEILKKLQNYYKEWQDKTLPDYKKKRYIHIGSEKQNPLMLYSCDWQGTYADGLWNLIEGDGSGAWEIMVDTPGEYEITLYRWHPASGIAMDAPYQINGNLNGGKIPVALAILNVADVELKSEVPSGSTSVKFIVNLKKGTTIISTELRNKKNEFLCSAYYTKVELID